MTKNNNFGTKKFWQEKVKNNDFTHKEWDQYSLYMYCDYWWVKLKDILIINNL